MSDVSKRDGGELARRRVAPKIPIGFRPAPSDEELETTVLERWQGFGLLLTLFMALHIAAYLIVFEPARTEAKALKFREHSIERGAHTFALNDLEHNPHGFGCAECHGANAEGGVVKNWKPQGQPNATPRDYPAPNLRLVFKRQLVDLKKSPKDAYQFVFDTIARGRASTPMPTWGLGFGGPLNDQQIEDVMNYLLSIQEEVPDKFPLAIQMQRGPFSRLIAFSAAVSA